MLNFFLFHTYNHHRFRERTSKPFCTVSYRIAVRCYHWVRTCCRSTSCRCLVITAGPYFTTRRSKPSGTGSYWSLSSTQPSVRPTSPPFSSRAAAIKTAKSPVNLSIHTGKIALTGAGSNKKIHLGFESEFYRRFGNIKLMTWHYLIKKVYIEYISCCHLL